MPTKHFILKELLDTFHDTEREKDKVLKANQNYKDDSSPGHRKHVCPIQKLLPQEGKSTVRTTLGKFLMKKNTLSYSLF